MFGEVKSDNLTKLCNKSHSKNRQLFMVSNKLQEFVTKSIIKVQNITQKYASPILNKNKLDISNLV